MQREGTLIVMILKMKNDFWCLPLLVYFTNSFWQVKNPCQKQKHQSTAEKIVGENTNGGKCEKLVGENIDNGRKLFYMDDN